MYIQSPTLDDLLRKVFSRLLRRTERIHSTRGESKELTGMVLGLSNPRARLSRTETKGTVFSAIGELLWYLAGSNLLSDIEPYIPAYRKDSEDALTIYGAYGPRLLDWNGSNQLERVIQLLRDKPRSRRAVVQIFDADDLDVIEKPDGTTGYRIEIPCTCTLQFLIRGAQLHMVTYMRSNDAFLGLPHDIFTFTMLQEIVANTLGVNLGKYKHCVGSLHLYDKHFVKAQKYIDEGFQDDVAMPRMPKYDPWNEIRVVLEAEQSLREGEVLDINAMDLDPYWKDLLRLVAIYFMKNNPAGIKSLRKDMHSKTYGQYINKRHKNPKIGQQNGLLS